MTSHPASLIGTDVDVYWNLHKNIWSVRDRKTRRVVAHVLTAVLSDVTFKVSAAGNARVRAEGKKNVHAFARGTLMGVSLEGQPLLRADGGISVTYNPYRYTTFVDKATESPVHHAEIVILHNRNVTAVGVDA